MNLSAKRVKGVLAIVLCAASIAGCGGGPSVGTSTLPPQSQDPILTTQSTKSARGKVRFAIGIKPKATTGRITPKYVSPSTQSLQILSDGASVVVNLTPSSPNCSRNPTVPGAYTCAVANFQANSVSIFDTANGNAALPAIRGGGLSFPTGMAVY